MLKKRYLLAVAAVLLAAACSRETESAGQSKKDLVLAFGVGNYIDQVKGGIVPLLEKKGYKVELKQFSQNRQINPALDEGSVDASVNQSRAYMNAYGKETGSKMTDLTDSSSAPQSLRSKKHKSLDDVQDGMLVVIPNDPVNAERAARVLESVGWVKIKPDVNPLSFAISDILPGKYRLQIKEADAAQALRLMDDADFVVVNGNYVAGAGEKISDGLAVEDCPVEHRVMVTVMTKNKDTQWAKDLKEAFESKEYADYIRSQPEYSGFIEPRAWAQYPK